jgi:hypothetical protein
LFLKYETSHKWKLQHTTHWECNVADRNTLFFTCDYLYCDLDMENKNIGVVSKFCY